MKKIIPDVIKTEEAPKTEETPDKTSREPETLDDGTELVYAREDSGRNLPHLGLALEPGYLYVVGEDFDGAFGQRLVETGICRLADASSDVTKVEAAQAKEEAPTAEGLKAEDKPSLEEVVKVEVTRELAEHQPSEHESDQSAEHQSNDERQSNDEHQP